MKSYALALADFDKAIALGTPAYFDRGMAYLQTRDVEKATKDFRTSLEKFPDFREAASALRILAESGNAGTSMQVRIVRHADAKCGDQCAEWIAAEGRLDEHSVERFRSVLRAIGDRKLPVFVDSAGGHTWASIEIGRMIRARHLDVYVSRTESAECSAGRAVCEKAKAAGVSFGVPRGKLARCASACANILAAGTMRSVGTSSLVGVHQAAFYAKDEQGGPATARERKIPDLVYTKMKDYLVEMGIDAALMLKLLSAPHASMYWLTRDDLRLTRLANQTKSGEELITGSEVDDWIVTSPKAVEAFAKR